VSPGIDDDFEGVNRKVEPTELKDLQSDRFQSSPRSIPPRQGICGVPHVRSKQRPTRSTSGPIDLIVDLSGFAEVVRTDDLTFKSLPRRHKMNEGVFISAKVGTCQIRRTSARSWYDRPPGNPFFEDNDLVAAEVENVLQDTRRISLGILWPETDSHSVHTLDE
jgi:hypothetical protein